MKHSKMILEQTVEWNPTKIKKIQARLISIEAELKKDKNKLS